MRARSVGLVAAIATLTWGIGCGDDAETTAAVSSSSSAGGGATTSSAGGATSTTSATGGSGGATTSAGGGTTSAGGGGAAANPHPLYPALDLDTLPGDGGAQTGAYTPPTLPTTTTTVTVTTTGTQAADDLETACGTDGTAVTVPDAAGDIGYVDLGNVDDCDITLGAAVVVQGLNIGRLPGPTHAPSHRLRIRGGQIGSVYIGHSSSDIVLDGVAINNGVTPPGNRNSTALNMPAGSNAGELVERFALINSFIRMVGVTSGSEIDGSGYIGQSRDLLFANNNIVTSGNRNSWAFRLNGGENILIVDNTVRVSFHKLVRINSNPADYVYIKGGTWMRESTLTSGGQLPNDSFQQLSGSTIDHIYVHDPIVYLMADALVGFGATAEAVQNGRTWEARNIVWHALNDTVVSAATLQGNQDGCTSNGGLCDYGIATHTFNYDTSLALPTNAWRDLPTFADDNPDNLPVAN